MIRFPSKHTFIESPAQMVKYETIRYRAPELQCFNKKAGKIQNLTDYLWLSIVLATAAENTGKLPEIAGISTCVDLRSRLPPNKIDYTIGKCFAQMTCASPLIPDMTLREIGKRIRADLARRRARYDDFSKIKFEGEEYTGTLVPGKGLEVSSIGLFNIKPPISDVWASLTMDGIIIEQVLAAMAFSVIGSGKNDVVLRLRYGNMGLGEDEVFAMSKLVDHFMRNISLDRTVQSAFDELLAFRKY
jgi:hypothetical protein